MISNKYIRIVVNSALVLLAALLALVGGQPISETLKWVTRVSAVVFAVLFVFENYLWRWSWLQRRSWFPVPNLNGTWKGRLISSYQDPEGKSIDPIEAYIVVRQSFLQVSVRQFTAQSASKTLCSSISSDSDGVKHLNVTYFNSPDLQHQAVSRAHHGSFDYCVEGHATTGLAGIYWTARGTFGDARFGPRVPVQADNFEHARQLFVADAVPPLPVPAEGLDEAKS